MCRIFYPILLAFVALVVADEYENTDLRMPNVIPDKDDLYLCTALALDESKSHFIHEFIPHATMKTAHHMLLYGCAVPGNVEIDDYEPPNVWNCGEMSHDPNGDPEAFVNGPVCAEGSNIVYAWARDAPPLKLPKDVAFKVGGKSPIKYLVVQVHYMHKMDVPDNSGLTLRSSMKASPKIAGTYLLVTGGVLPGKSKTNFDASCTMGEETELHPFAFRTHTHTHGKLVSGYRVRDGKWTLIGKRNPLDPQMFYPVEDKDLTITQGDILAARCKMENDDNQDVYIGSTGKDEMCNFYMMYWTQGDHLLKSHDCFTRGPPSFKWSDELEVPTEIENE